MSYRDTILIDNSYYHVYSRGNDKRDIFLTTANYSRFLDKAKEYSKQDKVSILCYCLMPNHYHFVLQQQEGGSITNFIHRLQVSYAMYFNIKNKRTGHLFQGPFKSKIINDDDYLLQVSRYIHINPDGIGKDSQKYRWSSLRSYLGLSRHGIDDLLQKDLIYSYFDQSFHIKAYKNFVFSAEEIPHDIQSQE